MIKRFAKFIFLTASGLASATLASGQVHGRVVDEQRRPVAFANVCLLTPDSTFVSGVTTDEQGQFCLATPSTGRLLRISCLSYVTTFTPLDTTQTLFVLPPLATELKGATVTVRRPAVSLRGTDIVTDVEHSAFRDFGNAADILGKMPMVYAKDGAFGIFGKGNTAIYINRRKVTDLAELSRINSRDIASIEIIRNPGVGYDADVDAVIKINMKHNFIAGWGIWAGVEDRKTRRNSDNETMQISYGNSAFNAFLLYGNTSTRLRTDQENVEEIGTPVAHWNLDDKMDGWDSNYYTQNVTGGLSVNLNANHVVGAQTAYTDETDRWGGTSITRMERSSTTYEHLSSDILSRSHYTQWTSNVYYNGCVNNRLVINFNGDLLRRRAGDTQHNDEGGTFTDIHTVVTRNENRYDIYSGLLTLTYTPIKAVRLTLGCNTSYVRNRLNNIGEDNGSEGNRSALRSEEKKYAVFAEGNYGVGRFDIRAGLRSETFKIDYADGLTAATFERRTYRRVYPFAALSYAGPVRMGLSVNTKVRRPTYYQLRNSTEYLNRYELSMGNPLLLPQYTTTLTYSANYKQLTLAVDYQWVRDYLMSGNMVRQADPLISVSQPINRPHYSAVSANLTYHANVGLWEVYANANVLRTFFDIRNADGTRANGRQPYFATSLANYFNLPKNWMPYANFSYNSDGYQREYRIKQGLFVSIGLVKRLLGNALYVRLYAENLLGTKEREVRYDADYVFLKRRFRDSRCVGIFLRYTFNNKKQYRGMSSADEETGRL